MGEALKKERGACRKPGEEGTQAKGGERRKWGKERGKVRGRGEEERGERRSQEVTGSGRGTDMRSKKRLVEKKGKEGTRGTGKEKERQKRLTSCTRGKGAHSLRHHGPPTDSPACST